MCVPPGAGELNFRFNNTVWVSRVVLFVFMCVIIMILSIVLHFTFCEFLIYWFNYECYRCEYPGGTCVLFYFWFTLIWFVVACDLIIFFDVWFLFFLLSACRFFIVLLYYLSTPVIDNSFLLLPTDKINHFTCIVFLLTYFLRIQLQ